MDIRSKWALAPLWRQVGIFLTVMFFVFLADAMLSDFVPGFVQNILGSPLLMGVVMSTSSIAGLILDFLFAKVLQHTNVKMMILFAFLGCAIFVLGLYTAMVFPWMLILVSAMVMWGVYFEFFGFASQKFVVGIAAPQQRAAVWSVMGMMRSIAYAIGPLALMTIVTHGDRVALLVVLGILMIGFVIFECIKLKYKTEVVVEHRTITIWHEFGHWKVLVAHIWPMVVLGITLGMIDATYWTSGTVIATRLMKENPLGGLFITIYMLSAVVVGLVIGKREIRKGKKKIAEMLTVASGLVLVGINLVGVWWWYLLVVLVSSVLSAMAWPLVDAVYTDLLARMGRENVHMVGLRNSTTSVAYIIGPILAGAVASAVGEVQSFAYLGCALVVVGVVLLVVTPRKLRLPQGEIAAWD